MTIKEQQGNAPYNYAADLSIDTQRDALLTAFARKLLQDYYLLPGENPQDGFARASLAWSGGDKALAQRLYDAVSKGWFMFASPVLSNAPAPGSAVRGMPISCFLAYVDDTLESLIDDHTPEVRWLSVLGGGVGGHWSAVRAASKKAPGAIPFLRTIDADMEAFKQGSSRKGSYAAYLDVSHPDIREFVTIRTPTGDTSRKCLGTGFHNAVNITDAFMEAVVKDAMWDLIDPNDKTVRETVRARELWEQILETRYRTGEPYLHYIDTSNRHLPETQKALGLRVNGSNLCVAPETPILTMNGYFPIKSLEGRSVVVWNGREWSHTEVKKTGTDQKLIRVTFSDGGVLDVTPYHKFYVQDGYLSTKSKIAAFFDNSSKVREVRAADLKIGDTLEKWELPTIKTGERWDNAYLNGFFSADGTYDREGRALVWLYGEKRKLAEHLSPSGTKYRAEDGGPERDSLRLPEGAVRAKFSVPVNGDIETKLNWLAGYLDGDGTVARNGDNEAYQFASINLEFLERIRLMLGTMGVQMKIAHARDAGVFPLPNGHGGMSDYNCQTVWRGLLTSRDTMHLLALGLKTRRLTAVSRQVQRDARRLVKVVSVEDLGRVDDTYCFNEPIRHRGMFNGILTGNCSEITLATAPGRTAVCCLSSLNAELYDEWKDTSLVGDVIEMLDNVLEYFIQNAPPALKSAVTSARAERSLGLGLMGWHSYLQRLGIAVESEAARTINIEMFSRIKQQADQRSKELALVKGEAPDMVGTGMRNAHLIAIAPNANSSILLATSPSIEIAKANAYKHQTRVGTWLVKNRHLEAILEGYGKNTDEVWKDIILSKGSVQHLEFLTEQERAVFKTAIEVDQSWVVRHAADRQPFICQAQSVNLFFPPRADRVYLNKVHMQAWRLGLKSLYYLRTEAKNQAEVVSTKVERVALTEKPAAEEDPDECVACQA